MDLSVVELFAGVGGFRVGLNKIKKFNKETGFAEEEKTWNFVWANQWEPGKKVQHAYSCYCKRFGSEKISNEDINKVDKEKIPNHTLLVGGFPCQDYSVARTISNEKGIEGKKGVLFWDIKDILEIKEPPFVLLENVDRLLKSPANQRGRDFAIMLKTFEKLGYYVHWRVINAAEYGMPQRRRRVFIFAFKSSTKYAKRIFNLKDKKDFLINEALLNKVFPILKDKKNIEEKNLKLFSDVLDLTENYDFGKFLNTGLMVDGKVIDLESKEIKEDCFPLEKVVSFVKKQVKEKDYSSYYIEDESKEKWNYLKGAKRIERKRPNGGTYFYSEGKMSFPDRMDMPARTMLTSEGTVNRSSHIILDNEANKLRTLIPEEAESIQMFPIGWTETEMSIRQRFFMMGNALVTGIISRLENDLKEIIKSE